MSKEKVDWEAVKVNLDAAVSDSDRLQIISDAANELAIEINKEVDGIRYEYELLKSTSFHGVERDIVTFFRLIWSDGEIEQRIPLSPEDTIIYEMSLKHGRADIVVFHIDGSCSVIEVKDGTKGYNHVVSGIGRAALYATQLRDKSILTDTRKCLLWTSTGDNALDEKIKNACLESLTVPLMYDELSSIIRWSHAIANYRNKCHA